MYRLGLPVGVLQEQETRLEIKIAEGLPARINTQTGEVLGLTDTFGDWFDFDVLILQRPMWEWQIICLRDARKRGIRTIVEIDDDFESLHNLSPAWGTTHPKFSAQHNRHWLRVAAKEADLVTVTTPALARRYAPHGRFSILPNFIPEAWLKIKGHKLGNVVGWSGTIGTHQGDLTVTHGGVGRAVEDRSARFRVIGNPELIKRDLGLSKEPEYALWDSYERYPYHLASLDVGLAPLAATAFNSAKSHLKPLEMAALGVPCVISPVAEYVRLHLDHGIGVLAKDRGREWAREVGRLLDNEPYRLELAEAGRRAVSELTIEKNAWRWAEAWTAVESKRKVGVA